METCGFLYFASFYSLSVCPMCEWIHKCVFAMITITNPPPPPFFKTHTQPDWNNSSWRLCIQTRKYWAPQSLLVVNETLLRFVFWSKVHVPILPTSSLCCNCKSSFSENKEKEDFGARKCRQKWKGRKPLASIMARVLSPVAVRVPRATPNFGEEEDLS